MGIFDGMFGPPLTPEEQAAANKDAALRRLSRTRELDAQLPYLRDAQRALREAVALGGSGYRLEKAQHHLALHIDLIETEMVRL